MYAIASKIQNFINSQLVNPQHSSCRRCMLSHQRYKISSIHNTAMSFTTTAAVVCYRIKDTKFHQFTTIGIAKLYRALLYAIASKIQNFINSQRAYGQSECEHCCMLSHQRYKISSIHNNMRQGILSSQVVCYRIKDTKFHQFTTQLRKLKSMLGCMLSHQRYKISSIHNRRASLCSAFEVVFVIFIANCGYDISVLCYIKKYDVEKH